MQFNHFAVKNLMRSKIRTLLTVFNVAIAAITLFVVFSLERGYQSAVQEELVESTGAHLYITREGCPIEAASVIAQGGISPLYVPQDIVERIKNAKHVRHVMPFKIFAITTPDTLRTDIFLGITDAVEKIRPAWKIDQGDWFKDEDSIILGAEIARLEKREIGDKVYFEEFNREFTVAGILERNNLQDDGTFFLPLATAQALIRREGKLSAVAVALDHIDHLQDAKIDLLGKLPEDYYVIPPKDISSGIMRFFGSTKAIMFLMIIIAFGSCVLGVANTMMMVVQERRKELAYLKCVGAGFLDVIRLIFLEVLYISLAGIVLGLSVSLLFFPRFEVFIRQFLVAYIPTSQVVRPSFGLGALTVGIVFLTGLLAALYPIVKSAQVTPMEALRNE